MHGKILILKTGELPAGVCAKHGSCDRQFLNFLSADDDAVVVDARVDSLVGGDWAGIVITGSGSSVFDCDPWIRACGDFLKRAEEKKIPIYGVCFGHQLLAQTFGGRVERCARGWELGTVSVRRVAECGDDQLFAGMPATFLAQESHRDVVTELPPGAIRLAENDHAPVQAFRLGERIWGTQFHPEFNEALMGDMVDCLAETLPRESFTCALPKRSLKDQCLARVRESPEAGKCLQNFVRLVVGLLMFFLGGLQGCSTSEKHDVVFSPITGRAVRCDLLQGDMAEKCVEILRKRGYVFADKLTPEQRAQVGSQNVISLDALTPEERRSLNQRGVLPPEAIPSIP